MDAPLQDIERVLRDQLSPLEEEASRLRTLLADVEDQSARLTAALAALTAGHSKSRTAKRGKPCATKQEVATILVGLLEDNGSLTVDDLEGLAKDKLSNQLGKSLSGFRLRYQEALADPRFAVSEGRCQLQKKTAV
ncbi:MAG: hypothetical protein KDA80_17330 [Planctomycetaceae bacterium]|nr:hypothetical protein [Planctomycetaceae bacterium]